ncbi:MAG: hypothetical protein HUJ42_00910 [Malacoplasma sp.]|nr:hypothetical protein [Malacoplasma sp.]
MNFYINFLGNDNWLQQNISESEENVFINPIPGQSLNDLLLQKIDELNLEFNQINSINVILSLKGYKEEILDNTTNFENFNKTWNFELVAQTRPLIKLCRVNNIFFNFIFIYKCKGNNNVANIALFVILKTFVIGLNTELTPFKTLAKLIILDRAKKEKLKNLDKIVSKKNKLIVSNSILTNPLSYRFFKKSSYEQ